MTTTTPTIRVSRVPGRDVYDPTTRRLLFPAGIDEMSVPDAPRYRQLVRRGEVVLVELAPEPAPHLPRAPRRPQE